MLTLWECLTLDLRSLQSVFDVKVTVIVTIPLPSFSSFQRLWQVAFIEHPGVVAQSPAIL
jgi:hypothetical protein